MELLVELKLKKNCCTSETKLNQTVEYMRATFSCLEHIPGVPVPHYFGGWTIFDLNKCIR